MNFGNIKLPQPIYDCKISTFVGVTFIEIRFFREVDSQIVDDLMSLEKDGVKILDYRKNLGFFSIPESPYDHKELAQAIAIHLEQQHNLKVLRDGF